MEDEKSSKAKPLPSLPANYVTIVQLQERWKKEQERKEMEKEAEERRLLAEKERSEMQIRLQEKVEPDSRPRYGRYRNAGARRDDFEVGNGKSKGFGQKEELVGRGRPRVTAEGCARREGAPARVSSKREDVRVLGLHGKSENISADKEIGSSTVCRRRNEGRRMIMSVQFVPETENLSVNEDYADQKNTNCSQGNRTVQYVPKLETQVSQATKPRNSGNKMDSCVEIDGEMEKVPRGKASKGSKSNRGGGKRMGGNEDIDEELEKDLKSGSSGGSYSKGANRIGRNVEIDRKPEKILNIITRERINRNSSGGNRMKEDIDEKMEKDPVSDTMGGSNNNSGGSNGIDKNVDIDGKLKKVPMGGARIRNIGRNSRGNMMNGDADEESERVPMSGARGGSNNYRKGSNKIVRDVDIDGKSEKVLMSGTRAGVNSNSSGSNWMDKNGDIDEKLEKVPVSGARGGSNNYTNGSYRNVDTDGKLETFSMTGAGGGSNTSNEGDRVNQSVYVQGKLERVHFSGARGRNCFRRAEKRGFGDRSHYSMHGMVWVKKGEVSHDNAAGIQSSGGVLLRDQSS